MASQRPEHCHRCGGELAVVEAPTVFRCGDCADYVFHNPDPNARVVVVDGESALLVELADHARLEDPPYERRLWGTPGGHVEVDEQPAAAAARELHEETALVVDPDDLVLFDAVTRQAVAGVHAVVLLYAVDRAATRGTPEAGEDASAARFWSPAALADSDAAYRELHAEPDPYTDFAGLLDRARDALDGE